MLETLKNRKKIPFQIYAVEKLYGGGEGSGQNLKKVKAPNKNFKLDFSWIMYTNHYTPEKAFYKFVSTFGDKLGL